MAVDGTRMADAADHNGAAVNCSSTTIKSNSADAVDTDAIVTSACTMCGRKFLPERLVKHMQVCNKVTKKKRATFDSRQQRQVNDDENDSSRPLTSAKIVAKTTKVSKSPHASASNGDRKSLWREQHEEFIKTVREARSYKPKASASEEAKRKPVKKSTAQSLHVSDDGVSNGKSNQLTSSATNGPSSLIKTTPSGKRIPPGYVLCPTCDRTFNHKSATRHIEWCAEKKAQSARSSNVESEAMAKLKARTKYDPKQKRKSIPGTSNTRSEDTSTFPLRSSVSTVDLKSRSPVLSNSRRTPTKYQSTSAIESRSRTNHCSASPDRKRQNNANQAESRVKVLLESNKIRNAPKTPVVKFKEKFPPNDSSITSQYIGNHETLQELLKRPDTQNGNQQPKTVPGVRTGGMSPVRSIGNFEAINDKNISPSAQSAISFDRMMKSLDDLMLGPANGMFRDRATRSSPSGSSGSDGRTSSNCTGDLSTCHACGTKYPMSVAKYCFECGTRRLDTSCIG